MNYVSIQLQDGSGNWVVYGQTPNNSQRIIAEMKALASRYPNKRVRAVDLNGRLVDIL